MLRVETIIPTSLLRVYVTYLLIFVFPVCLATLSVDYVGAKAVKCPGFLVFKNWDLVL